MRITCTVALSTSLLLGACSDTDAIGAGAKSAARGDGKSYHLVVETRPLDFKRYFTVQRAAYDKCALNAKAKNMPVKPFPDIPADFVHDRKEYISDGKRFVTKETQHVTLQENMSVETGCEVTLATQSSDTLRADGKARTTDRQPDGTVTVGEELPDMSEPVAPRKLAGYNVSKTVKGVALKCSPEQQCIVDPEVALISDGQHPVQVAYRMDETTFGVTLVAELVSLSVGKPIDPAAMALGAAK